MEVQVGHRLLRLLAAVGDHTEGLNAHLLGDLCDGFKALGHDGGIFRRHGAARLDMLLGDDQEVGGAWGAMS